MNITEVMLGQENLIKGDNYKNMPDKLFCNAPSCPLPFYKVSRQSLQ